MRHLAAAHVFVDDIDAPTLAADDAHHLGRVLRIRAGEAVTAADGRGGWRVCAFAGDDRLDPVGAVERVPAPDVRVTVAFALTKGDKPELAVQKLTEVGVDDIVLVAARRSVVQWDEAKAARNLERLQAIAKAASMQSRRAYLPRLEGPTSLGDLPSAGLALAHPGGAPLDASVTAVAVGPEGGWSDDELAVTARQVDLGPTTLRAETAAVAAGVLLTALRDGRLKAAQ